MGRLTLVGAGHVFQVESAIREAIVALQPDIVFVELDRGRMEGLLERASGQERPASGGRVHAWLSKFQEDVAGMFGASVGNEMLGAIAGARLVGARLSLVDDAADAMLRRVVREVTWRERLRVIGMLVAARAKSLWPPARRRARAEVEEQVRRYQADPQAMMAELRRTFPTVHRILIEERDAKMARRIREQLAGARHGVAVVGDGHVGGMLPRLADLQPVVYRLADVREGRLPAGLPPATGTTTRVGFTVRAKT